MYATNINTRPTLTGSLAAYWNAPARSGMRRIIPPWEYRHLNGWAGLHLTKAVVWILLTGLIVAAGTWWALLPVGAAAVDGSMGFWLLAIARSLET